MSKDEIQPDPFKTARSKSPLLAETKNGPITSDEYGSLIMQAAHKRQSMGGNPRYAISAEAAGFVTDEYFSKPVRWKIRESLYKVVKSTEGRNLVSKFLGMENY